MGSDAETVRELRAELKEDNILGKVTNVQFRILSEGYDDEQWTLQEEIPRLRKAIEELTASATNVDRFLDIARKYTDMKELTPEILRRFITNIYKKRGRNAVPV